MKPNARSARGSLAHRTIARLLAQRLLEADLSLTVSVAERRVTLCGAVRSPTQRTPALEIAQRTPGVRAVAGELDLRASDPQPILPPTPWVIQVRDAEPEVTDRFVTDPTHTLEDGQPFFPPTDPVVAPSDGELDVRGGFSTTSMDTLAEEDAPALGEEAELRGDEAIADAVRRALQEDAMMTHLRIEVTVQNGVLTLRGTVPDLEDAEATEEVASRVPGVVEVRDLLAVSGH